MIRTAIVAIMVLAPSLATAQIVPFYYPDGSVYWRGAPMQPKPPPITRQQYIPAPARNVGSPRVQR